MLQLIIIYCILRLVGVRCLLTEECGQRAVLTREYVHHGTRADLGQWPWHVAVFHQMSRAAPSYACGGTLLSDRYVLTAGHCTFPRSKIRPLKKSEIFIRAGIANLQELEPSLQQIAIEEIYCHEDFNTGTLEDDIALLKLVTEVTITDYVRPICFWSGDDGESLIVGKVGYICGWGQDENGTLPDALQSATMPIVSRQGCRDSDPHYYTRYLYDRKTLCAGYRNGTSAGPGDSGGGLYLETDGRWTLRGIVSNGKTDYSKVIDTRNYIVFTDVAYYARWIKLKLDGSDAANILDASGDDFGKCGKKPKPKSTRRGYREERPLPWKGEIHKRGDTQPICEAAVINENFMLAPADAFSAIDIQHSLWFEVKFYVFKMSENQLFLTKRIERISQHENFNLTTRMNNIALIEVKAPIRFSELLRPICFQLEMPTGPFSSFFVGFLGNLENFVIPNRMENCWYNAPTSPTSLRATLKSFRGTIPDLLYSEVNGSWFLRGISSGIERDDRAYKDETCVVLVDLTHHVDWIRRNAVVASRNLFSLDHCPGPHAWMSSVHYRGQEKCQSTLVTSSLALTVADCVHGLALDELYPKFKTKLFGVIIAIAYIVPALIIYFNGFDGSFINRLQDERFIYWYDQMYHLIYVPFHTNMGCYLGGIILGIIYFKQRKNYHTGNRSWYLQLFWYSSVPIGFLCLMSNMIFYQYNFEKPSIWMAIYYPVIKHLWVFLGAIMIYGVIYEYNTVVKGFLNFSVFVPLGRLTYCAYVCHVFMLKNVFFGTREVGYFSKVSLLSKVITVLVLSYFFGLILALTLEFPATAIQKHLFARKLEEATAPPKATTQPPPNGNVIASNGNASSPSA